MAAPTLTFFGIDLQQIVRLPLSILLGWLLLFLTSFLYLVNLDPVDADIQLDGQVLVKLVVLFFSGLFCVYTVLNNPEIRRVLLTFPCVATIGVGTLMLLASAFSILPKESAVSSGSALVCMVLTISVAVYASRWIALSAIIGGQFVFVLGSWFVYLAVPNIGVFLEPIENGEFFPRMGGLAHPNTLGQLSGFVLVAVLNLFVSGRWSRQKFIWWGLPIVLITVSALYFSLCRSAMLATAVALMWGFRSSIMNERRIAYFFLTGCLGFGLLFLFFASVSSPDSWAEKILSKLTKSGSVDELTSATGRDAIWAETASLIQQRPVLGYGAATSKTLLAEYSHYTHNMFLNVALSAGVFAGGLLVLQVLYGLWRAIFRPAIVADSLLVCLFLSGMAENVAFEFIASGATALLTLTIAWHLLPDVMSKTALAVENSFDESMLGPTLTANH
jgi:exopolysaccharide production protein ExoQ